jgi:hypothetical protein
MNDYYSGYYWGMNPYDSLGLQGRMTDIDLRKKVVKKIMIMTDKIRIKNMTISVKYAIVTLGGTVETFRERRTIGEEIWKISGIFKILNLLKVSNPRTAGPPFLKSESADMPVIDIIHKDIGQYMKHQNENGVGTHPHQCPRKIH